jgi:hypothetical protein
VRGRVQVGLGLGLGLGLGIGIGIGLGLGLGSGLGFGLGSGLGLGFASHRIPHGRKTDGVRSGAWVRVRDTVRVRAKGYGSR